jgi:uncharacterized protein YkwD
MLALPRRCCAGLVALLACDPGPAPADEPAPAVPELEACAAVATWPDAWAQAEAALVAEINDLRAEGGSCGNLDFPPAPPVRMQPTLRCAARLHTADMIARKYVSSVDPDGKLIGARLLELGYASATHSEVVAVVTEELTDPSDDARDVVIAWRDNPTSCWQLYARELTEVGVGGNAGEFTPANKDEAMPAAYWTLTLAAPR